MYDEKTPEQKIQALFYQALKPLDGITGQNLGPLDIQVTVVPHPQSGTDPIFSNTREITIDFSNTAIGQYVNGMILGLINFGGAWQFDPSKQQLKYMGDGAMERAPVPQLQAVMAGSMTLDDKVGEVLGRAAQGAGARAFAGGC